MAEDGVMTNADPTVRAEAVIDLAAVGANVDVLRRRLVGGADLLAVVKADGYGHGAVEVARTAVAHGAVALGVATLDEGVALAGHGFAVPVVAWLWPPGQDPGPALRAGVQLAVSSLGHLDAVLAATAGPAQIHLKIDTGLGRNGVTMAALEPLLAAAAAARAAGRIEIVGLMSHLASADVPDDPSVAEQTAAFIQACEAAAGVGIRPRWRHLANTSGHPGTPGHPFRHGPDRHRHLRHHAGRRPGRAAAGDDVAGARGAGQAGAGRAGDLLRTDLPHDAGDHPGAGAARLRRRHPAHCVVDRGGAAGR